MSDQPEAASLLQIAHQTLLGTLLAELPDGYRYEALMVANAMAIAGREIVMGEEARRSALEQLTELYANTESNASIDGQLRDLRGRLAAELRQGGCDRNRLEAIRAVLVAQARRSLAISNPKYLAAWER